MKCADLATLTLAGSYCFRRDSSLSIVRPVSMISSTTRTSWERDGMVWDSWEGRGGEQKIKERKKEGMGRGTVTSPYGYNPRSKVL